MSTFQSITGEYLAARVRQARERICLVAPGVHDEVSQALIEKMSTGAISSLALVLDGDEECCRLGYCDASALSALSESAARWGVQLRRQPGLRVGLLIVDSELVIWSPTPLMFEAPAADGEPNGVVVSSDPVLELSQAVVPHGGSAEIGTATMAKSDVETVVKAIKAAPPAPFDLTRLSRVFSSKFQFIEATLRGAELIKREIQIDSLVLNSDAPKELRPLLQTKIQPFYGESERAVDVPILVNFEVAYRKDGQVMTRQTTQADIRKYWDDLLDSFIITLPGFGKIIRYSDKNRFENARVAFEQVLKAWVEGFRASVKADHEGRVKKLADLIQVRMEKSEGKDRLDRRAIEDLVRKGLEKLRVIEPEVKVVYKNISVESARDSEFLAVLGNALPEKDLEGWFKVYNAAPMLDLRSAASGSDRSLP